MFGAFGNLRAVTAGTAIIAASWLAFSPAIGSVDLSGVLHGRTVSLAALGGIGSFTPVTNDKRLARAYAGAFVNARNQGFRFTPSVGSLSGRRSITIVVRAPDLDVIAAGRPAQPSLGLGPVAYNLGTARGLRRFATETGNARGEIEPIVPATALTLPRSFKLEGGRRLSTNLSVEAAQGTATPQAIAADKPYAVDFGSSYKLTRNLDVTAGVRYRARQTNRLGPLTDDTQDSQAVYLGTSFKF